MSMFFNFHLPRHALSGCLDDCSPSQILHLCLDGVYRVSVPKVNQPRRSVDHPPPSI